MGVADGVIIEGELMKDFFDKMMSYLETSLKKKNIFKMQNCVHITLLTVATYIEDILN